MSFEFKKSLNNTLFERLQKQWAEEEIVNKIYGSSRGAHRFKGNCDLEFPKYLEENGWVLRYFNIRPNNSSDYILYKQEDLDNCEHYYDRIPCIEFRCSNHSLDFQGFSRLTIIENIPKEVHNIINKFIKEFKTTNQLPVPVNYLKLYIAVLEDVPSHIVPTLVAHSVLGAHLWLEPIDIPITLNCDTIIEKRGLYKEWLQNSFRKCVVKVNRKEFEKISKLNLTYLGHENKTLNGEKSCAVAYPVWHLDTPNVLKFAKLWSPT